MHLDNITAGILAGGKSIRMGQDKSFLNINETTFIEKIYSTLSLKFSNILISSDDPQKFYYFTKNIVADLFPEIGPLSGIYSLLRHIRPNNLFLTTCDLPLLNLDIINTILSESIPNKINIVCSENDKNPLLGLYPGEIFPELEQFIISGKRKVRDFLSFSKLNVNIINLSKYNAFLINVNESEDYAKIIMQNRLFPFKGNKNL